jgi:hypothetical protein
MEEKKRKKLANKQTNRPHNQNVNLVNRNGGQFLPE